MTLVDRISVNGVRLFKNLRSSAFKLIFFFLALHPLISVYRIAYNIVKFVEDGNFVNFSLTSPANIGMRLVNLISSRYEFVMNGTTVIRISCGMVTQSHIESISSQLRYPYHELSLLLHCQEAKRFESCVCMIAGKKILIGQTFRNAISFQTGVAPNSKCTNESR